MSGLLDRPSSLALLLKKAFYLATHDAKLLSYNAAPFQADSEQQKRGFLLYSIFPAQEFLIHRGFGYIHKKVDYS